MKKFVICLFLLQLQIMFIGCSDDGTGNSSDSLTGLWKMTKIVDGDGTEVTPFQTSDDEDGDGSDETVIFNGYYEISKDGDVYTYNIYQEMISVIDPGTTWTNAPYPGDIMSCLSVSNSFTVDGNTLSITDEEGTSIASYTIDGETMMWTFNDPAILTMTKVDSSTIDTSTATAGCL